MTGDVQDSRFHQLRSLAIVAKNALHTALRFRPKVMRCLANIGTYRRALIVDFSVPPLGTIVRESSHIAVHWYLDKQVDQNVVLGFLLRRYRNDQSFATLQTILNLWCPWFA